jgi:hypothetical protein
MEPNQNDSLASMLRGGGARSPTPSSWSLLRAERRRSRSASGGDWLAEKQLVLADNEVTGISFSLVRCYNFKARVENWSKVLA